MDRRQVSGVIERAVEAVTGSLMARTDASVSREGWRAWRLLWATLEATPLDARMVTVCMYCEHLQTATRDWIAMPQGLAEMVRDCRIVQVTHGVCPICLAGHWEPDPARVPAREEPYHGS